MKSWYGTGLTYFTKSMETIFASKLSDVGCLITTAELQLARVKPSLRVEQARQDPLSLFITREEFLQFISYFP